MPKQIILNAFNMNCVGHINHGLWAHPRDRSHEFYKLSYWTDLARTLERGLFDGLFIADILGVYDVYEGGIGTTAREAVQLPVHDPIVLVPAMAAVTQNLGFGITVNVGAEQPYLFARRLATLDHLSEGRMGWNIVTGYIDSAARALGLDKQIAHDTRYDRADEFLALTYELLERGWDDDAVRLDKANRVYADPAKVHEIVFEGQFYRSRGYQLALPSIQRTPVIYQAGTSGRGRRFAGQHAECIFISSPDIPAIKAASKNLRQATVEAGRKPEDIKILGGVTVVVDETQALAEAKYRDYLAYASPEAGLAHFAASTGIDFDRYGLDDIIPWGPNDSIQSANKLAEERGWTKRRLMELYPMGGRYPVIVGDGDTVAAELGRLIEEGDIDGFNLSRTVVPESFEDFVTFVVPKLQARGLYKTEYGAGSLRHKLFGQGDRLKAPHPAAVGLPIGA